MTMEQSEELQPLDKSMMPAKLDEGSRHEPDTWYKVALSTGAEEAAELSSPSEDELNISRGKCRPKPMRKPTSLIRSQKRIYQKFHDHMPLQKPLQDRIN